MGIAPPYLAAAGEAPARGDRVVGAHETQRRQAQVQRAAMKRFVRDNPARTFGIVALCGAVAGLILLRR
ncbi:MAG TPA: hypothetical protein VGN52_05060 [Burkholderiales bacterium]